MSTQPGAVPCGNMVKCYDYLLRTCLRPLGHAGGCNPFSDSPPIEQERVVTETPPGERP